MSKYYGLIIPRSYNDYYRRDNPAELKELIRDGTDAELNAESENAIQNKAVARVIPSTASAANKLVTQASINDSNNRISAIEILLPNETTEENQLADKAFVNSTVGTNTANYIYKTEVSGDKVPFNSVTELEAYTGSITNNDYAFVTGTDASGNIYYDRYKANVTESGVTWAKEYRLNNSSFTSEQWAAIQSGISSEKVEQINENTTEIQDIKAELAALTLIAYPVGTLYWTENSNFDPNIQWGGTWVRIKNKFIYAAGDNDVCGSVGGEATHTLTEAEMPRHSHGGSVAATNINHSHSISHSHTKGTMEITGDFALNTSQGVESATGAFAESGSESQYIARFAGTTPVNPSSVAKIKFIASQGWTGSTSDASNTSSGTMSQNAEHSHTINSSGSSVAHNNMPPYEVAICWKREE